MSLLLCKFSWCWMMEKRLNPNLNKFLQFLHISLSSCLSCTVWDKPRGGECYFCIFGNLRGMKIFLSDVMWMVEIKHWHQMKTFYGQWTWTTRWNSFSVIQWFSPSRLFCLAIRQMFISLPKLPVEEIIDRKLGVDSGGLQSYLMYSSSSSPEGWAATWTRCP